MPSTAREMTLGQLEHLLRWDLPALLGLTEDEMDDADADDLRAAAGAWKRVELANDPYSDAFEVAGRTYVVLSPLTQRSVREQLMVESATERGDLATLVALFTRPAETKLQHVSRMIRRGDPVRRAWAVALRAPRLLPVPFDEAETRERAEAFRRDMTASRALSLVAYFSRLSYELALEAFDAALDETKKQGV